MPKQETPVPSLGQEDPLEEEMATHSSISAWKIPWTEEPGGLHSSWGHKESDATERACTQLHTRHSAMGFEQVILYKLHNSPVCV